MTQRPLSGKMDVLEQLLDLFCYEQVPLLLHNNMYPLTTIWNSRRLICLLSAYDMTEREGVDFFAVDLHARHRRVLHHPQVQSRRCSQGILVVVVVVIVVVFVIQVRIPSAGRPDSPKQAPGPGGRVQQKGQHPHLPRQHQCRGTRPESGICVQSHHDGL